MVFNKVQNNTVCKENSLKTINSLLTKYYHNGFVTPHHLHLLTVRSDTRDWYGRNTKLQILTN